MRGGVLDVRGCGDETGDGGECGEGVGEVHFGCCFVEGPQRR